MLLTEYNEAEAMELFKEDGRREGRAEGRGEDIRSLMVTLGLTVDQPMDALRIPMAERSQYLSNA